MSFTRIQWFGWDGAHRAAGAEWHGIPVLLDLDIGDARGIMHFTLPCCSTLGTYEDDHALCPSCDRLYGCWTAVDLSTWPTNRPSKRDMRNHRYWLDQWDLNPLEVELLLPPTPAEVSAVVREGKGSPHARRIPSREDEIPNWLARLRVI